MKMERETKQLQTAIDKGELFEYMVGEKGYKYVNRYADMPTDDEMVFASIESLYEATRDVSIWDYFKVTWIVISEDPVYSWLALYYLSDYLNYTERTNNHVLAINEVLPAIISNIKDNKNNLINNKRWGGCDYDDGLWGDVKRLAANLNKHNGLSINL